MDGDRLAEQLKGRGSQMDGDSRSRSKEGRAGLRSPRGWLSPLVLQQVWAGCFL